MPTQVQQNEEWRQMANTALTAYMDHRLGQRPYASGKTEPIEAEVIAENIADLLSDLMHLAHHAGLEVFPLVESAKGHFFVEHKEAAMEMVKAMKAKRHGHQKA